MTVFVSLQIDFRSANILDPPSPPPARYSTILGNILEPFHSKAPQALLDLRRFYSPPPQKIQSERVTQRKLDRLPLMCRKRYPLCRRCEGIGARRPLPVPPHHHPPPAPLPAFLAPLPSCRSLRLLLRRTTSHCCSPCTFVPAIREPPQRSLVTTPWPAAKGE